MTTKPIDLAALDKLHAAATPGPWYYDSYAGIFSGSVPRDHPLNIAADDEPPTARLLSGHGPADFKGDDLGLACKESAANCQLTAWLHNEYPALSALLRDAAAMLCVFRDRVELSDPPKFRSPIVCDIDSWLSRLKLEN